MIPITLPRCLDGLFRRPDHPAPAAPRADAERILGCGWFDSSHDLRSGLRVREHDTPDAAAELPLAIWLDWHMAGHALAGHALAGPQHGAPSVQA